METIIIYRDNSLYTNLVPMIVKILENLGFSIEIQVFPQGTPKDDIGKWMYDNETIFSGKILVSDFTCSNAVHYTLFQKVSKWESLEKISDLIMLSISDELTGIKKDRHELWGISYEQFERQFIKLLANIFLIHRPQKVYIVKEMLNEHQPFNQRQTSYDEMLTAMEVNIDSISIFREMSDEKKCYYCGNAIKTVFKKAGISPENIVLLSLNDFHQKLSEIDTTDSWIATDRHVNNLPSFKNALHFRMPLSDFVTDARNHSLLSYTDDELSGAVEMAIKETLKSV